MDVLSTQINQYFDLKYNQTINYVIVNNLYLYYDLNLTNVSFSAEGLTFQALYSIYDHNDMVNKGLITEGVNPEEMVSNRLFLKNLGIGSKNLKLPLQFFQDMINTAHKQHYFNYIFNQTDLDIKGFQFYIGDLSFVMPTLSNDFYPDTKVDILCGSSDETPPLFQVLIIFFCLISTNLFLFMLYLCCSIVFSFAFFNNCNLKINIL